MPRLRLNKVTDVIKEVFGEERFSSNFEEGKKAFDWEIREAIVLASEEQIVKSLEDAKVILSYVKNNLEEALGGFNTKKNSLEKNKNHLRTIIVKALQ